MSNIEFMFFDAGGGHRSSASALVEAIRQRKYPWEVRMTNLQELLDPIDVMRRSTGVRIEDIYNGILKHGWTLGARHVLKVLQATIRLFHREQVKLLREHWRGSQPDLVVSVIPHFNRAIHESLSKECPGVPFVTVLTDIADYPPRFWIGPQHQHYICGSDKAVQQTREMGIPPELVRQSGGMIIHPRFYEPVVANRASERLRLGLRDDLPTGLVMFGGQGSKEMLEIARRLEGSSLQLQLIFICGRNQPLAERLRRQPSRIPRFVEGFTKEIPYYMHLADFFIGKPGPGSISEALAMNLPVIVQRNSYTLPQERYNADWIREKEVGLVVQSMKEIGRAVDELLQPDALSRFRTNAAEIENRAVFEIPLMLEEILSQRQLDRAVSLAESQTL